MVSRPLRTLTAAALVAAAACGGPRMDALPPGADFPAEARAAGAAGAELVWVVRPEDYLTCRTAADGVRRIQRAAGGRVPLTVVAVGPHDEWVRAFLRRQRIRAQVVAMDEDGYVERFGRRPGPWLYLLRDGKVQAVTAANGAVPVDASLLPRLEEGLEREG